MRITQDWRAGVRRRARGVMIAAAVGALVGGLFIAPTATAAPADAVAAMGDAGGASSTTRVAPMADLTKFQPGNIVSDAVFFNKNTMTAAQIQSFLQARVATCQSGYTCLKDWYDTSRTTTADAMCGAYSGGTRERASTIIYKVAQACGINPQVILVMLEKEQGLVRHTAPTEWRYTIAMGQGCPDTAACDTRYYGFFNQVFGAAWQLKRYANPPGTSQYFTWYAPGKTWNVRYHPNVACGSSPVLIANQATANLYYYTPYQPNAAALRAGYGLGDSCSAYGNRNFYQFFTDWFGSTHASVDACAQPPDARVAVKSYVVTAISLNARLAPSTSCADGVTEFAQGTVVQATGVVDGWLRVNTEIGERWVAREYVRYATTLESSCALPAPVASAKYVYTVTVGSTPLRSIPHLECAAGISGELGHGVVAQAVAVTADKSWLKVRTGMGDHWIARGDVRRSTEAESACVSPLGAGPAKLLYVVRAAGTTGRASPSTACASGKATVSGGTVLQALEVSAARDWLKVSTGRGELWVLRAHVTKFGGSDPCTVAPATRAAVRTYTVVRENAVSRLAPTTSCAGGAVDLVPGTVISPHSGTTGGDWIRVTFPGGDRWVARSDLRFATEAEACSPPVNSGAAKLTYAVALGGATARVAPHSDCVAGAVALPAGTIATAVEVSAARDWLKVRLPQGDLWVLRTSLVRVPAQ